MKEKIILVDFTIRTLYFNDYGVVEETERQCDINGELTEEKKELVRKELDKCSNQDK